VPDVQPLPPDSPRRDEPPQFHQQLLDAVGEAVIATDLTGRIVFWNRFAEQLYRWPAAEVIGRNILDVTPTMHSSDDAAGILALLAAGTPWSGEFPVRRRDGTEFTAHVTNSPWYDCEGRLVGIIGVSSDVTARKQMETLLAEEHREVLDADRRKDELLAMLAHELRNPLAPMLTTLELIRLRPDDAATLERGLGVLDRQVRHLAHLLDDLLDLSRLRHGRIQLRRQPVEVAEAVRHAIELARAVIDQRGHELTVDIAPGLRVAADPDRLVQIVANLLHNAAKYTPTGGHLRVAADGRGDDCVLRVRDDGIGMSQATLRTMFEPFAQGDRERDVADGLGLGLSLVRSVVEMHGGSVTATSEGPGRGSEIVVRLPGVIAAAADDDAAASGDGPGSVAATAEEHGAPSRARRVLVVDDNTDAAEILAAVIEELGCEVRIAHDGEAAMDAAVSWHPDTIFLDIGLPKLSGHEVARRIRAHESCAGVRLFALTGFGQDSDRQRSMDAGFDAHLVKPIDIDEVTRLVDRHP
jgi:PAS domain S-box-containing protein